MKTVLKSKALESNLAQTREIKIHIPENHQWLLSLSENYWGIHTRLEEFLKEYHHPYSNRAEILKLLYNILIGDFWIYKEIKEQDKVIEIFFEIFNTLLKENLPEELSKQLVYIYLNYFDKNFDVISKYESLSLDFVHVFEKNFEQNYFDYISNIDYFFKSFSKASSIPCLDKIYMTFMRTLCMKNIDFWDESTNIEKWYHDNKDKMSEDYTKEIASLGKSFFDTYNERIEKADSWEKLSNSVFTFSDIIDEFRKKIDVFKKATEQFSYIFYLLHLPGMRYHRHYLLIDLNRAIKRISQELNEKQCVESIKELFSLFSEFKKTNINIILDSILTLGKETINTRNEKLIHCFEEQAIKFGFVSPGVNYLTDRWILQIDPNHVKNIRVWLDIIEYDPEVMQKLLSALIINLHIGGIFIFDTDLFQKDVTKLINARISPIYKRIKQLTRIFPVYFNEIGAEGLLRDVTTRIDEISQRNDKLIHFLRKQIHTEGNNSHIQITLEIIKFWNDRDINRLKNIIPVNVLNEIDVNSCWVKGVHEVLKKTCKRYNYTLEKLLLHASKELEGLTSKIKHDNQKDIERVHLIIKLYQLLKEKYSFETNDIIGVLERFNFIEKKDLEKLNTCIKKNNDVEALKSIYTIMSKLNKIIFDAAISEGWENIYHKRHIAYGIPSMYGEYHETKFEALGVTFRLERIASLIVNKIISGINLEYFTAQTLKDIFSVIELLTKGLSLDGIHNQGLDSKIKIFQYGLTSGALNTNQYVNLFQFIEASLKKIINTYFIRPYDNLLKIIIPQYLEGDNVADRQKKIIFQKSEVFYRNLLSSAFLVQIFDNFIGKILNNLREMTNVLSHDETQNIMSYVPDKNISPLYEETPEMDNQIFLGSKAFYLKKLYLWKYPVPTGFIITTEVFRILNSINKLQSLNSEFDDLLRLHISKLEHLTGLKFGDAKNPLLLSVRSGSTISMPGIMNTFLNVGLNDEITEALSKRNNYRWTSWDCYRRLIQTWGMSFGLDRNEFDQIMIDYKQKYNISKKIDFPPQTMREIAYSYKQLLIDNGIHFETDPFLQIKQAIISVFNSWNVSRAKVYREHMQVADEWGTAVLIQKMVFGNMHRESGSGVLFTHDNQANVSGINIVGDFSFLTQGEDIVAGLVNTLPISERQRLTSYHDKSISLESVYPKIFKRLEEISRELLEIRDFGHQEIEFTFETAAPEDLYILQTRDMEIIKKEKMKIFAISQKEMERVGCGIGIGKGVLNGVTIFDQEDLITLRKSNKDQNAVLVRPDTVPDDIEIIFDCEGLLTGKGGATSHAAVTAANLGKICVVNCTNMNVFEREKKCVIGSHTFSSFDPIAIDGINGIIYKGNYPIEIKEL